MNQKEPVNTQSRDIVSLAILVVNQLGDANPHEALTALKISELLIKHESMASIYSQQSDA